MFADVAVPFYCGTTQQVINHSVEHVPKKWPCGTRVKVLEQVGADLFRVELPDGQIARIGRSRLNLHQQLLDIQ